MAQKLRQQKNMTVAFLTFAALLLLLLVIIIIIISVTVIVIIITFMITINSPVLVS